MSLEQTLERTNTLLEQLLTVLQTGLAAEAELGKGEKRTRTNKKSATFPDGTVFWSIPKFNSVFAQEPGMQPPTIDGAVQCSQEEYEAKKAELRLTVDQVLAKQRESQPATTTGANGATPSADSQPTAEAGAGAAQSTSTQQQERPNGTAQTATAGSAGSVAFPQVLEAAKKLNASQQPGHGREGVMAILRKLLPDDPQPTVTKLDAASQAGKVNLADALKAFEAPFAAAQAEFDPLA